jgi:ureidoacrylate peracid hydrolase
MEFDSSKAAFLAVDIQRAFCSDDGSVAREGRDIDRCKAAAARCLDIAAAAHQSDMPVIWTRFVLRADYSDGGVFTRDLRPWVRESGALQAGTPDIELIPEAEVAPRDFVIDKKRYSSFYSTELEAILRSLGIECLLVGGVTTSMCVETSVRDAAQRDYKTFLVRDACADYWEDRHVASLAALEFGFARVISHNEAIAAISGGKADF